MLTTARALVPFVIERADDDAIRNRVATALRCSLEPEVYDAWFRALKLESIDGETAMFTVPTKFLQLWIKHNYIEVLEDCCFYADSGITDVVLTIRTPAPIHQSRSPPQLALVAPAPPPAEERPRVTWPPHVNTTEDQLALLEWFLREAGEEPQVIDLLPLRVNGRILIHDIVRVVARHFGLSICDMLSQKRHRTHAFARQVGMYIAKQLTDRSLPEIGRRYGNRDHTTVLHALRKIDRLRTEKPELAREIDELIARIRG